MYGWELNGVAVTVEGEGDSGLMNCKRWALDPKKDPVPVPLSLVTF